MLQYVCLSRGDHNQTVQKKIPISTSYTSGGTIDAFTTYFQTNGTHFKCYSNEEWAQQWFELDRTGYDAFCNTSNVPIARIGWM